MDQNQAIEMLEGEHWRFNDSAKRYRCGWCGQSVAPILGVNKEWETMGVSSSLIAHARDIRICPDYEVATTFYDNAQQLPAPLSGETFNARNKTDDVQLIVALYEEARRAISQLSPSCAVLMFRKLLMHVAVEKGAAKGLKFVQYVDHLKNNQVVGKPQYDILDRIKNDGNTENHEIVRASKETADDLLSLATLLIKSIYFTG